MGRVEAADIDALLPQTQCTRCGYDGCRPYAEAIAAGAAPINQCPPGGAALIGKLAALLGCDPLPLNPHHGVEAPAGLDLPFALRDDELSMITSSLLSPVLSQNKHLLRWVEKMAELTEPARRIEEAATFGAEPAHRILHWSSAR